MPESPFRRIAERIHDTNRRETKLGPLSCRQIAHESLKRAIELAILAAMPHDFESHCQQDPHMRVRAYKEVAKRMLELLKENGL